MAALRIGISIPLTDRMADPSAVRAMATAADQGGYACIWAQDQLLSPAAPRSMPPFATAAGSPAALDPVAVLTLVAAVTERIGIGTNVLAGPWYPPVLLARSLTSLDVLSGGRLRVGLGLGWSADDLEAAGVAPRHLPARVDELLDVLDAVWGPDPVAYTGARVRVCAASVQPKPVQRPRPPVLLAARTPAGLERVARRADGWAAAGLPIDALAPMWRVVRELAAGHGRDPERLELVVRAGVSLSDRPLGGARPSYCGSLEQVAEDLVATAAAGADEVVMALTEAGGPEEIIETCDAIVAAAGLRRPALAV